MEIQQNVHENINNFASVNNDIQNNQIRIENALSSVKKDIAELVENQIKIWETLSGTYRKPRTFQFV
jgi:hypothetical protein